MSVCTDFSSHISSDCPEALWMSFRLAVNRTLDFSSTVIVILIISLKITPAYNNKALLSITERNSNPILQINKYIFKKQKRTQLTSSRHKLENNPIGRAHQQTSCDVISVLGPSSLPSRHKIMLNYNQIYVFHRKRPSPAVWRHGQALINNYCNNNNNNNSIIVLIHV